MKSKKILEELNKMKSLLDYRRGVVISEQVAYTGPAQTYLQMPATAPQQTAPQQTAPQQTAPQQTQQPSFPTIPYGSKPLVDCTGLIKFALDAPTAQQQMDFQKKSGLNPNVQENKQYYCSLQKMSSYQVKGDTVSQKKQTVFAKNENFPLKFQQQGEKIKQLQTALDVRNKAGQPNITGKFWTATEAAIMAKAKELGLSYDRNKGVDEDMFNKIIEAFNTGITATQPREKTGGLPKTVRDIQSPTSSTTSAVATANTTK